MTPPNLQCLPTEVLLLIVSGVGEQQRRTALAGLSRANKTLHTTCNPFLYHDAIKDNAPEITTLAARHGNLDTLMKAHEYGADLNAVTWVPIPSWTEKGNVISQDWSKIADDDFGYAWATPLAVATCEGHYHVVKYLLTLHVDVDAPGKLFCDCDVPKSILEDAPMNPWEILHPTHLETVCCAGVWTPLHFALCRGKTSIARLLISCGASLTNTRYPVRSQIPRGNGIASLFGLDTVDTPKAAAIRKRLGSLILSLGPRETVQSEDGDTEADNDDSESGAGWIDDAGSTACAIHTAVTTGNEAIVRRLVLDYNFDINQPDSKGANALHYALKTTRVEMVLCVLSLGADPNIPFDRFDNAAEWALFLNHSRKWASGHLNRFMQVLLDSGVSLWTKRRNAMAQPGEKSMMINRCIDWLPGNDFFPCDGWFRRFILGSIAEYDENRHRKLKREKMDLFWSILFNYQIPVVILDVVISTIGPIDFMELVSEDTAPPGVDVVSAGVTIGKQAFRCLRDIFSRPIWGEATEGRRSIIERIGWISKQGVPMSHKTFCLITEMTRRAPHLWDRDSW